MYLPLNREHSKKLAIILIVAGILLLPDIMAPTPGADLINLALAMPLADLLSISYSHAVMVTFGVAFVLLLAGLLVYPYNTVKLVKGRSKAAITFLMSHPLLAVVALLIFYLLFYWSGIFYETQYHAIKEYAVQITGGI